MVSAVVYAQSPTKISSKHWELTKKNKFKSSRAPSDM
jgi:hypothetical protein